MTENPNRIWAWAYNCVGKYNGRREWVDFKPVWKKPLQEWVSTSWWNPFAGYTKDLDQDVTEYVSMDSVLELLTWIEDNAPEDFWEKIPVDLWNKVTVNR